MGEKFFLFDKSFLRGHNNPEINFRFQFTEMKYNPEINFRFQITEIKQSSNLRKIKNRNDFTHFDFIFSDTYYNLPSHKEHQELRQLN